MQIIQNLKTLNNINIIVHCNILYNYLDIFNELLHKKFSALKTTKVVLFWFQECNERHRLSLTLLTSAKHSKDEKLLSPRTLRSPRLLFSIVQVPRIMLLLIGLDATLVFKASKHYKLHLSIQGLNIWTEDLFRFFLNAV